jgi:acyl-CoA synthetase (AMP-forming)/AMP-acid ligase II
LSDLIDFAAMPTLADVPRYHARVRPDATALAFEGRETSFAAFEARTNQAAQALMAEGLKKGDRIAYLGKNSDHYFELLFGATKVGVVMVPIGWRLAPAEVAYIVGDAEARMLFVGPEVAAAGLEVSAALPGVPVIAMEPGAAGWPTYEAWRDASPPTDPLLPISPKRRRGSALHVRYDGQAQGRHAEP